MKQIPWFAGLAVIGLIVFACRSNSLSPKGGVDAKAYLKAGAPLIDVRTVAEFEAGHLPGAINIPVDEVTSKIPLQFTNQSQTLLLYCRSGRRSGLAEQALRTIGYTNVFNLGSYQQAEAITGSQSR